MEGSGQGPTIALPDDYRPGPVLSHRESRTVLRATRLEGGVRADPEVPHSSLLARRGGSVSARVSSPRCVAPSVLGAATSLRTAPEGGRFLGDGGSARRASLSMAGPRMVAGDALGRASDPVGPRGSAPSGVRASGPGSGAGLGRRRGDTDSVGCGRGRRLERAARSRAHWRLEDVGRFKDHGRHESRASSRPRPVRAVGCRRRRPRHTGVDRARTAAGPLRLGRARGPVCRRNDPL